MPGGAPISRGESGKKRRRGWRSSSDFPPRGRGFFEPRRVVLAGIPNAGKSTLFNRLLGRGRVVADAAPGTTRDLIEERTTIGAYPIWLVDGAGLRETEQTIEGEGVRRMRASIDEADLVVYLEPPEVVRRPKSPLPETAGRLTLKIRSRADQISPVDSSEHGELLGVSALTGSGVEELQEEILRRLFGAARPPLDRPVPFLRRHEEILREARSALAQGRHAREILARL